MASLVRGQPEVAEMTLSQHHWCHCWYCEIGRVVMLALQWRTRGYCSYCVIDQIETEAVASLVRGQPEIAEVTLSQRHWCPCSYYEISPIEAEAVISFVRG